MPQPAPAVATRRDGPGRSLGLWGGTCLVREASPGSLSTRPSQIHPTPETKGGKTGRKREKEGQCQGLWRWDQRRDRAEWHS